MKFQIYTDDGRWVDQYKIYDEEFEKDFCDSWIWLDFFDYLVSIKKETN